MGQAQRLTENRVTSG